MLIQAQTRDALAKVKAAGVEVIYPDKQPFIDAVQPLHQALKDTPVGALMAKIAAMPLAAAPVKQEQRDE